MARHILLIPVFLFSNLVSISFATFEICEETCQSTYSLHTNDQVEELKACVFGCRISFIKSLTSFNAPDCSKDCKNAYPSSHLMASACKIGCEFKPNSIAQDTDDADEFELGWHTQIFQPFFSVREYYHNMFRHAHSVFIASSFDDQGRQDSSSVVVQFKFEPMTYTENDLEPRNEESQYQENDEQEGKENYRQIFHKIYVKGKTWLDCVEKRLGLPSWFLCLLLFLSFVLMTWVCCSTCDDDSNDNENVKKHNFSREVIYDGPNMEKVPLFFVNPNDDEQAGPLPTKQPLS